MYMQWCGDLSMPLLNEIYLYSGMRLFGHFSFLIKAEYYNFLIYRRWKGVHSFRWVKQVFEIINVKHGLL